MTAASATAAGLARFEDRGPCTDAERRAAAWLHDELRAAGHEAWVETHWVRPQWALSLALHATLGVVASLLALAAPAAGGDRSPRSPRSRWRSRRAGAAARCGCLFPRRATQNVLDGAGRGEQRRTSRC